MKTCTDQCDRERTKVMPDGTLVCSWCLQWMLACEARHLLGLPLMQRRIQLDLRDLKRGETATDQLRKMMVDLHQESKMAKKCKGKGGGKKK